VANSLLSLSGKRNENNTMIDAQSTIKLLCEKFPAFAMYGQRRRLLALGIHKEIDKAMPMLTEEQISEHAARARRASISWAMRSG
jgi:hypothetical protein